MQKFKEELNCDFKIFCKIFCKDSYRLILNYETDVLYEKNHVKIMEIR